MHQPLISIIIPTYNAGKTLGQAIDSLRSQKFTDIEIVVVDGLSTDDTVAIAESYEDERIRAISEKDKGIYDAMNKGIGLAKGGWLFFLGSDDYLVDADVLENVAHTLQSESPDLLYGNVYWGDVKEVYGMQYTRERLLYSNICHQAMFYNRSLFDELGVFNPKYKTCADWDFNLRLFDNENRKLIYKDLVIAYFNLDGFSGSNSDNEILLVLDSRKKDFYKNPYYKAKKVISGLQSKMISLFTKADKA